MIPGASLDRQAALVTGASRGIGLAIAHSLAALGAHVFLGARSTGALAAAAEEIRASGGSATPLELDVAEEKSVARAFNVVESSGHGLDILVNNAGTGTFGTLAETRTADFDRIMAVNLRGTFLCCREAMKRMVPQGGGYIVNISSVVGFKGYSEQSAYAASKHGVQGITKSLAVEAQQHGIRVSAVLPGGVDTDLVSRARPELNRSSLMQPEDVARVVAFLVTLPPRAAIDQIYIRRSASTPF